jgi:hypothetical protein
LQAPPHTLPSLAHSGRDPCGGPVTGEQVPTRPVTSHASQAPPHAALQHTPSVQMPETHCVPDEHWVPLGIFGEQIPLAQKLPVEQSVLTLQLVLHAVAPQA